MLKKVLTYRDKKNPRLSNGMPLMLNMNVQPMILTLNIGKTDQFTQII